MTRMASLYPPRTVSLNRSSPAIGCTLDSLYDLHISDPLVQALLQFRYPVPRFHGLAFAVSPTANSSSPDLEKYQGTSCHRGTYELDANNDNSANSQRCRKLVKNVNIRILRFHTGIIASSSSY